MTGHGEESSLDQCQVIIKASEVYPKKAVVADDDKMQVPFPELCGESVEFLGKTTDGVIALSNYRMFVRFKDSFVNVPLGVIESVEYKEMFYIYIGCKDAHSFRCAFLTNQLCLEWYKRVCDCISLPKTLRDTFCFAFHAYWKDCETKEHALSKLVSTRLDGRGYSFDREVDRLGLINRHSEVWRITHINEEFKVCSSYPKLHIVPRSFEDKEIENAAKFRGSQRFPSVVWRDRKSGAVICRSSQPEVGWLGWRGQHDENLIAAIASACEGSNKQVSPKEDQVSSSSASPPAAVKKMLIVDARSYTAALANRTKGGGCECIEYYPHCEIQFMSLPNIHTIRKSFHAVRTLCSTAGDQLAWLQSLETTKWLQHMSSLLRAALVVVEAIDKKSRPVLVHCSDGWDRTPQIVATAELMLDPFYRTIEGFRVLVEREWLEFGHKFADRCGIGKCTEDTNERCPVFIQFLDCVHQLLVQCPCAFQFNDAYLVKLAQHTYSNLFGTFLCNNTREREEACLDNNTLSVWSLLYDRGRQFINPLYIPNQSDVLEPSYFIRDLHLWRNLYMSEISSCASLDDLDQTLQEDAPPPSDSSDNKPVLPKTRSMENLMSTSGDYSLGSGGGGRRLSDPNIKAADPNLLVAGGKDAKVETGQEPEFDIQTEQEAGGGSVVIKEDVVRYKVVEETVSCDTLVGDDDSQSPALDERGKPSEEDEISIINDGNCLEESVEEDKGIKVENGVDDTNEMENGVGDTREVENGGDDSQRVTSDKGETLCDLQNDVKDEFCDKKPQCSTDDHTEEASDNSKHDANDDHTEEASDHSKHDANDNHLNPAIANDGAHLPIVHKPFANEKGEGYEAEESESRSDDVVEEINRDGEKSSAIDHCDDDSIVTLDDGAKVTDSQLRETEFSAAENCASQPDEGERECNRRNDELAQPMNNDVKNLVEYRAANMSTSTSDISDSRISINSRSSGHYLSRSLGGRLCTYKVDNKVQGLALGANSMDRKSRRQLNVELPMVTGMQNGGGSSSQSDGGSTSDSLSPGSDKMSSQWLSRQVQRVTRHLDVDGLKPYDDPAHTRLLQVLAEKDDQIRQLENSLIQARQLCYQINFGRNGLGKTLSEAENSGESEGEVEQASLGGHSNASDLSYDKIDWAEEELVKWVPDHAATHCGACELPFSLIRRRHHCRNCGNLFCDACSRHYMPVPNQQLTDPVRVCQLCYVRTLREPVVENRAEGGDMAEQIGMAMEEDEEAAVGS